MNQSLLFMFLQLEAAPLVQSFRTAWVNFLSQVPGYLTAILIVALGVLIAQKITQLSRNLIARKTGDPLMTNFLSKSIKVILVILAVMFALRIAGLQGIANTLLTAAGASAIIIGFAFKDIGENFISGIILSFNRPFNVNDTIQSGDIFGKVISMEFRYTKIKSFDGKDVYVPNSILLKTPLLNYTEDGFFRMEFIVGIDYADDILRAEKIILEAVSETPDVLLDEEHAPFVVADLLDVSTVNLKVLFWIDSEDYKKKAMMIRSRVMSNVKNAIIANGLNMPANIHEIKLYGTQQSIPIAITSIPTTNNSEE